MIMQIVSFINSTTTIKEEIFLSFGKKISSFFGNDKNRLHYLFENLSYLPLIQDNSQNQNGLVFIIQNSQEFSFRDFFSNLIKTEF